MGQKYTNMREMYQQVKERVDLSEKLGDSSDMKRLSGELKNASKTHLAQSVSCLLYTSPSPRDDISSRMPSSA